MHRSEAMLSPRPKWLSEGVSLKNGAQPSDTVRSILSKEGVLKRLHEEKNAK